MNKTKRKRIFLSWSYSRRSEDIAALERIEYVCFPLNLKIRILQFPILFVRTIILLFKRTPGVIFVQHPPVHILFPVLLYSLLSGARFIIDSHITPGTTLVEKPHHRLYLLLHRCYSYHAMLTLFHSKKMLDRLKQWRCNCMVLENPVRHLDSDVVFPVEKRPAVGMVTSFSKDEHIQDVIDCAREMKKVSFYITGDRRKAPRKMTENASANVHFTGYIQGEEYYAFLGGMDLVIVLTDREESALLGAYEAVSAETPLIVSDTETMRYYFPKGVVQITNDSKGIEKGIRKALNELQKLESEIKELKKEKYAKQRKNFQKIDLLT